MKKLVNFIVLFCLIVSSLSLNVEAYSRHKTKKYLFIGDSRFYGIKLSAKGLSKYDSIRFNCAGSASTLSFEDANLNSKLKSDMDLINEVLKYDKDYIVVYNLGINCVDGRTKKGIRTNYKRAIKQIKKLSKHFNKVYFCTVGYTDSDGDYAYFDKSIKKYNKMVIRSLPSNVKVIKSHKYLKHLGDDIFSDGLHYTSQGYQKWYSYIMKKVGMNRINILFLLEL